MTHYERRQLTSDRFKGKPKSEEHKRKIGESNRRTYAALTDTPERLVLEDKILEMHASGMTIPDIAKELDFTKKRVTYLRWYALHRREN